MSNGFETCDKHTYLFATEAKDCPYCRIDELEQQLAEVERLKEESSHLWVRIESGEAAAYEQGKAEARKQAASEILDSLTQEEIRRITSVGDPRVTTISSKLLAMMAELRQRFGLEG